MHLRWIRGGSSSGDLESLHRCTRVAGQDADVAPHTETHGLRTVRLLVAEPQGVRLEQDRVLQSEQPEWLSGYWSDPVRSEDLKTQRSEPSECSLDLQPNAFTVPY